MSCLFVQLPKLCAHFFLFLCAGSPATHPPVNQIDCLIMSNKPKKEEENLVEKVKKTLFLKGRTSSQTMNDVLKDLALMAKPYAKTFHRKNDIIPFEDAHSLEFLGPKNDCGLFALASHSKKRPNNLVLVGTPVSFSTLSVFSMYIINYHSKISIVYYISIHRVAYMTATSWTCSNSV